MEQIYRRERRDCVVVRLTLPPARTCPRPGFLTLEAELDDEVFDGEATGTYTAP